MMNKTEKTVQTEIDRISAAIANTPPNTRGFLRLLAESAILGAQIAEQCAANLSTQKDAS